MLYNSVTLMWLSSCDKHNKLMYIYYTGTDCTAYTCIYIYIYIYTYIDYLG